MWLRAGDVAGAQELAGRPQNQGAPEWTLYYADLARLLVRQGRAREARGALDLLSLATRDGCEALLARRDVGRALEDDAELAAVSQRLSSLRGTFRTQDSLLEGAKLWVCVDPEQGGSLEARLAPQGAALVRYGWGVGRGGMLYLQSERAVPMPLAGLAGWRALTVKSVAGPPVRVSASLSASPLKQFG